MADKPYKHHDIQLELERQSRLTLAAYEDYRLHPRGEYRLLPRDIGVLITAALFTIAYIFVIQVGIALNKSTMETLLPGAPWQAGVVIILGIQFLASVLLAEMFSQTRVLTATVAAVASVVRPGKVDALMDKLRGVSRRSHSPERQIRIYGSVFIGAMLLVVVLLSVIQTLQTGDWAKPLFVAMAFVSDAILGMGPAVLLFKSATILLHHLQNRKSEQYYKHMEALWLQVGELFDGWRNRYFEENPESGNDTRNLPAISPLAAFIVQNSCGRDVKIPENVLRATQKPDKVADETANQSNAKPGRNNNDDDDKDAGAASVAEEKNPLDDPDPVISAMDIPIDNENL